MTGAQHQQSAPAEHRLVEHPAIYVFDMDGVLWCMDDPLPGAAEAIARLRGRGDVVRYLTNNSSQSREDYVRKLARFGMRASIEDVMTSAYATARLLHAEGCAGRRAYVIGEEGLRRELTAVGIDVIDDQGIAADYVIVGWDRAFTYQKLALAHAQIMGGARFIATNRDATYPDAGGRTLPGGGSLVAAVETCTGTTPQTVGKPEPASLRMLLEAAAMPPERCVVVGDRLDTDIAIGKRTGCLSVLVTTGVSTRADAARLPPHDQPDLIIDGLTELP